MRQISEKEYQEYRRLKSGTNDWISEEDVVQLTGLSKKRIGDLRRGKKLKARSLFGRSFQYSKSQIESLFNYNN